jgi:hypothetical protein
MKVILATLGASLLVACGDRSDANLTLYIYPPKSGCVGVAGFEVKVSQSGQADHAKKIVGPNPILDPQTCRLPDTFKIDALDIESPVTVDIQGYDGAGRGPLVQARTEITNLRQGEVRLELARVASPMLLVFDRGLLLQGNQLSSVNSITVSIQRQQEPLLSVSRDVAQDFFNPEPGAYIVQTGLNPPPMDNGVALSVELSGQGVMSKDRVTMQWDPNGYYRAQ